MENESHIAESLKTLGIWLVEHQVKLVRTESDLSSLEDSFDALVKRVVLLEQNWE